jgi:cytoskeletal protein RodZ
MVAHRKNVPSPRGYVPSSGLIVLTVMVVIGAAGWLGWLVVDDDAARAADAAPSSATTAPAPAPESSAPESSEPPTDATPAPSPEPEPEPETEKTTEAPAEARREAGVAVLNNSGVTGAARAFSVKVTGAGWTVQGIGNWRGAIPANTVYYPAGLQAQARLLAEDVGIERVLPSVAPMGTDRLTIILSGPQ